MCFEWTRGRVRCPWGAAQEPSDASSDREHLSDVTLLNREQRAPAGVGHPENAGQWKPAALPRARLQWRSAEVIRLTYRCCHRHSVAGGPSLAGRLNTMGRARLDVAVPVALSPVQCRRLGSFFRFVSVFCADSLRFRVVARAFSNSRPTQLPSSVGVFIAGRYYPKLRS